MSLLGNSFQIFIQVILFYSSLCDWVEIPQYSFKPSTKISGWNKNSNNIPMTSPRALTELTSQLFSVPESYGKPNQSDLQSVRQSIRNPTDDFEVHGKGNYTSKHKKKIKNVDKDKLSSSNEHDSVLDKIDETENLDMRVKNSTESMKNKRKEHLKTLEIIIKILNIVKGALGEISKRNIKGKTEYLNDLKDEILTNIVSRINSIWPDDEKREKRSAKGGHVDFPSAEGALMSISFLTFAVFLIKFVMQVIHTYKSKTMMLTPVIAAMGKSFRRQNGEL